MCVEVPEIAIIIVLCHRDVSALQRLMIQGELRCEETAALLVGSKER